MITILVRIVSSYEYNFLKVKIGIKELGNEIVLKNIEETDELRRERASSLKT
jgi:hypothetical protein